MLIPLTITVLLWHASSAHRNLLDAQLIEEDDTVNIIGCDFDEQFKKNMQTNNDFKAKTDLINARWLNDRDNLKSERRRLAMLSLPNPVIIPINFHIIVPNNPIPLSYNSDKTIEPFEIGYEQILSQMYVLNEAFFSLNDDVTTGEFAEFVGNFTIQFTINKIIRIKTDIDQFTKPEVTAFSESIDAENMLNIWVCSLVDPRGTLYGSATPPGTSLDVDGFLVNMLSFGSNKYQYDGEGLTLFPSKFFGKTAVHELGHWLNLRHIWGDGNCTYDDLVLDTPVAADDSHHKCPGVNTSSCGHHIMYMNYMDYSTCQNMFTKNQVDRGLDLFLPDGARERFIDYYLNPTNIKFIDYFYFIADKNGEDCMSNHKLIKIDLNQGSYSRIVFYLCISFSDNPYSDIITDIQIITSLSSPNLICPSDEYEKINTNLNFGASSVGLSKDPPIIYVCYKKQSQCSTSNAIVDLNVFVFNSSPYSDTDTSVLYDGYNIIPNDIKQGTRSQVSIYFGYKKDNILVDRTLCYEQINYGDIKYGQIMPLGQVSPLGTNYYQVVFYEHSFSFITSGWGLSGEQHSSVNQIYFTLDTNLNGNMYFYTNNMEIVSSCDDCKSLSVANVEAGRYLLKINGINNYNYGPYKIDMAHGTINCGETISEQFGGIAEKHIYRMDIVADHDEIYFESCGSTTAGASLFLFDDKMTELVSCNQCNDHGTYCGTASDLTYNNLKAGTYYFGIYDKPNVDVTFGTYSIQMMCDGLNYFDECGYKYIDDGTPRTWEEGEEFCNDQYGTNLATIRNLEDIRCLERLSLTSSPWVGLSLGVPLGAGSKCVQLSEQRNKLAKDCDSTLTAVLCNSGGGYSNLAPRIGDDSDNNYKPKVIHKITNNYIDDNKINDNDGVNYNNEKLYYIIFVFVGLIILINNIFVCYYCLFKENNSNNNNPKLNQQYESVQIIQD